MRRTLGEAPSDGNFVLPMSHSSHTPTREGAGQKAGRGCRREVGLDYLLAQSPVPCHTMPVVVHRLTKKPLMLGSTQTTVALGSAVAIIGIFLGFPDGELEITIRLAVLTALVGTYLSLLARQEGRVPLFDPGTLLLMFTLAYAGVTPLQYLLNDNGFNVLSDARLVFYDPKPYELGAYIDYYILFMVGFAITYLLFRLRAPVKGAVMAPLDRDYGSAVIIYIVMIFVAGLLLSIAIGGGSDGSYDDDLAEAYQRFLALPIPVIIAYNILNNLKLFASTLLVLLMFWYRDRPVYRQLAAAVFLFMLVQNFLIGGERTTMGILLVSALICFHQFVRPFSFASLVLLSVTGFAFFTLYGVLRGGNAELVDFVASLDLNPLATNNEFQNIFAGGFELHMIRERGLPIDPPWTIYFQDILIFFPKAIFPWEKVNPQDWYLANTYLQTFNYFMFHPVAQSALGLGPVEALIRGCVAGGLLGALHLWYRKRTSDFIATCVYVFCIVNAFVIIRGGQYQLLFNAVFAVVPSLILIDLLRALIRRRQGQALAS